MKPFTRAIFVVSAAALITAAFIGIQKELMLRRSSSTISPENVSTGSIVTLTSGYENPLTKPLRVRIEEQVPDGTVYIPGTLAQDNNFLTDSKDYDQGYFDQARNTVVWDVGQVAPHAQGNVSYQVRVTGERQVMQSVTKVILDPGTEDEEVLTNEPFVFYLGKPLPAPKAVTPLNR